MLFMIEKLYTFEKPWRKLGLFVFKLKLMPSKAGLFLLDIRGGANEYCRAY